jgi:hypothetical protein
MVELPSERPTFASFANYLSAPDPVASRGCRDVPIAETVCRTGREPCLAVPRLRKRICFAVTTNPTTRERPLITRTSFNYRDAAVRQRLQV